MIIFNHGFKNKYYFSPFHRIIEPFVLVLSGIVDLVLLPTPYKSCIYDKHLRNMIKAQMKKRIKEHNK